MTKTRIKIWVARAGERRRRRRNATTFAGFIGPIKDERKGKGARIRFLILRENPRGGTQWPDDGYTHAYRRTHTCIRVHCDRTDTYVRTHVHIYARATRRMCIRGRESTEEQSVSVARRPGRAISDNLFRKQWKRAPRERGWIFRIK